MIGAQVDWRDSRHWHCNNNVHPSRHGTYDGLSMHPFETIFIKARQWRFMRGLGARPASAELVSPPHECHPLTFLGLPAVQASWHVGEPFTEKYTEWALAQARPRVQVGHLGRGAPLPSHRSDPHVAAGGWPRHHWWPL